MTKLFRFRAADFSDGRNTTPAVVAALAETESLRRRETGV